MQAESVKWLPASPAVGTKLTWEMASDWGRDITPVTMETLDDIGAFRSDLGHFCRWPCNAKPSNIKSNFTKSQPPLYSGMYSKPLEEQQKERIGREMTNVSLSYNVRRTMGRKIEPEWKKGLKGNWVCVYKRMPFLSELSNSTSCFGETWLKWWLRCFVS